MNSISKALLVMGILSLCIAGVVLVFTYSVLRYVARDDVYILTTRYDPDGDPAYAQVRTYEELYKLTEHIADQHNRFMLRYHYALGLSGLVLGIILTAWSLDRRRLQRRMSPEKSNGTAGDISLHRRPS